MSQIAYDNRPTIWSLVRSFFLRYTRIVQQETLWPEYMLKQALWLALCWTSHEMVSSQTKPGHGMFQYAALNIILLYLNFYLFAHISIFRDIVTGYLQQVAMSGVPLVCYFVFRLLYSMLSFVVVNCFAILCFVFVVVASTMPVECGSWSEVICILLSVTAITSLLELVSMNCGTAYPQSMSYVLSGLFLLPYGFALFFAGMNCQVYIWVSVSTGLISLPVSYMLLNGLVYRR